MPFTFAGTILLFCNLCLRIWSIPIGMKFAAWFLMGFNSCMTPMIFPFVHLIMKDDNEAKSFTTGAMVSGPLSLKIHLGSAVSEDGQYTKHGCFI